jgi:pimeloyl-ACP methyl ester carboxylesterase
MAPVARALEDSFRVLEPFQRRRGAEPLTVARHVADLHAIAAPLGRPALVGSSWGAMLALAYAAAHPASAGPLVLVGCGTFDPVARERFKATVAARMDDALRARIAALEREEPDPDRRLAALGELLTPLYTFDPLPGDVGFETCDARGHEETWADMLRLQADGTYPAAFAAIESPVLMLHGAFDPHPGAMIRDSLAPFVRRLEYVEWERCGHYPWLERAVRDEFFAVLRDRLARHPAG